MEISLTRHRSRPAPAAGRPEFSVRLGVPRQPRKEGATPSTNFEAFASYSSVNVLRASPGGPPGPITQVAASRATINVRHLGPGILVGYDNTLIGVPGPAPRAKSARPLATPIAMKPI